MIKKLIKHGDSAAIILDKSMLKMLNVTMDTPLELSTDGKNLIISPVAQEVGSSEIFESLKKINKMHGKTLKRLAE